VFSKEVLGSVVSEIYEISRGKDVFEQHGQATVVAVYLFTSQAAMKDKSEWIAMLMKGPNDNEPKITFNEFKLNALQDLLDDHKSKWSLIDSQLY
jgi:hypothetical protein